MDLVLETTKANDYNDREKNSKTINHHDDNEKDEDERKAKENKSKWIKFFDEQNQTKRSNVSHSIRFDRNFLENDLSDNFDYLIDHQNHSEFEQLVCGSIPNDFRPFFWSRFSKASFMKIENQWSYSQLIDLSIDEKTLSHKQIEKILQENEDFLQTSSSPETRNKKIDNLQRIFRIVRWWQKTSMDESIDPKLNHFLIGTYLIQICPEETSCWLLLKLITKWNLNELIGFTMNILDRYLPHIKNYFDRHEIEFKLIASIWFATLLIGFVPDRKCLFLIWDLYFYQGPICLIQLTIGMLLNSSQILEQCSDSKEFFNALSDLPMRSLRNEEKIVQLWRCEIEITKKKNIKQTRLLMRLHESIVSIANHFQAFDLETRYVLEPDYDSVDRSDTDEYLSNRLRSFRRRAKALLDFPSDRSDELCFHRNDIITLINENDEHCWIGEFNGKIGWFPAKFVESLDERCQDYCIAGDDRVVPFINVLVRGRLCSALKAILTYDLKQSYFFNLHPWSIIEKISNNTTHSELKSAYSRLVLTKTFNLDQFNQLLSPNDLLYRSIALVNATHQNCPMDIKLRSLICLGLNQNCLHDWFESICTGNQSIIEKSYGPNSFLRTPAWKLIKAELKLLIQFSFYLSLNMELELMRTKSSEKRTQQQEEDGDQNSPVTKEGVCEMLVKYHLFSWDI
ncbi:Run and tbc1 domain-containing protein [Sarcoptes scabiei]|uniref:RUN and TBC1 domain-containing protein 3 n=1 Tax=Sarcoptes scabiei TaxID=52283 RepID=A0A132ACT7_SARSC|nr:Run and tbc1 domain-containing protein [Sarcoptes scabiei]